MEGRARQHGSTARRDGWGVGELACEIDDYDGAEGRCLLESVVFILFG